MRTSSNRSHRGDGGGVAQSWSGGVGQSWRGVNDGLDRFDNGSSLDDRGNRSVSDFGLVNDHLLLDNSRLGGEGGDLAQKWGTKDWSGGQDGSTLCGGEDAGSKNDLKSLASCLITFPHILL